MFSFDSPQEYNADFVMATLATTTMASEDVSVRQRNSNLATTSAKAVSNSNHRHSVSNRPSSPVNIITTDNEVGATATAIGLSIAETPKDSSTAASIRERTAIVNGSSNGGGSHTEVAAAEDNNNIETITHNQTSQDANNLLDSLFDDIVNDDVINDDVIDDVYGFTHHSHTSKGIPVITEDSRVVFVVK